MALHKDVKSLHIGCDEVYHLGECSDCSGQGRTDVFVKHVSTVANYVKNKYPHVSLNLCMYIVQYTHGSLMDQTVLLPK